MKKLLGVLLITGFLAGQVSPAFADANADMMSMLQSMKDQMSKMQQTIDAQSQRIQQLETRKAAEVSQPSVEMMPVTASQISEADWQKGIKDNIGGAVPWLKDANFKGDFRLRYEAFDFYDQNSADSNGTMDRTRNRFRIRLRWGFEKKVGDDVTTGFRLVTGSESNVTSTNETLGDNFAFDTVLIDRAYAKWTPNGLKDYGPLKGVTIGAGKFENPFLKYATTIVWDSDVTPEGAYEKADIQLLSTEDNKVNLYATAGQFITAEGTAQNADTEIYAGQAALNWSTYNFNTEKPVNFTTALSYYDYPGYKNTTYVSFSNTNTAALNSPRVWDFYNEAAFSLYEIPTVLWFDYVNNVADVDPTRAALNEVHDETNAWGLGVKLGKLKKKGDWEASYGYYQIGANAVAAAFSDSDFGGPNGEGFSNRKGHKFGIGWQIAKSVSLNWTSYLVAPYNTVPTSVAKWSANESVFRSQFDVIVKF